jgi:hypothetical protein
MVATPFPGVGLFKLRPGFYQGNAPASKRAATVHF